LEGGTELKAAQSGAKRGQVGNLTGDLKEEKKKKGQPGEDFKQPQKCV